MTFLTFPRTACSAVAAAALLLCASAQAADFNFSGSIGSNTDVVQIDFTLNASTSYVAAWTDSYQNGTNYDPNIAIWQWTGSSYSLLASNDDNPDISATQTSSDAGLQFETLAAGQYKLTISAYGNSAVGSLLSEGFALGSNSTPISTADFGGGGNWSATLNNVDSASISAVPEPATWALMLTGLAALAWVRRQRQPQSKLSAQMLRAQAWA